MTTTTLLDRISKDNKLGTVPDSRLAKEYGTRVEYIGSVRRLLGIKSYAESGRRAHESTVGGAVAYAKERFSDNGGNREKAIKETSERFGIKKSTVQSYLYWASSAGSDVPRGLLGTGRRGRKTDQAPLLPTPPGFDTASRIAQLEDMVLKVAVSNTELLATLRQNGVIK